MSSMLKILNQLDELNVQQRPYSDHYALKFDENTRIHYSALLLMALLQEGSISGQQQRMLDLWLPAIGLSGRQVELCELAARLAENNLAQAIKYIQHDQPLAKALLLDMMVFSRVEKPLSDITVKVLEALAGFFKLAERDVADIVYFAAFILGLDVSVLSQPDAELDLSCYSVYDEFLFNLRSNREKRLFEWVTKNDIKDIPLYSNSLSSVTKLLFKTRYFPVPEEIDLLTNLKSFSIYLERGEVFDENSFENIRYIKNLNELTVYTYYLANNDRENFISLPNEIVNLVNLKKIVVIYDADSDYYCSCCFKYISEELKRFIKYKNIELMASDKILEMFKD